MPGSNSITLPQPQRARCIRQLTQRQLMPPDPAQPTAVSTVQLGHGFAFPRFHHNNSHLARSFRAWRLPFLPLPPPFHKPFSARLWDLLPQESLNSNNTVWFDEPFLRHVCFQQPPTKKCFCGASTSFLRKKERLTPCLGQLSRAWCPSLATFALPETKTAAQLIPTPACLTIPCERKLLTCCQCWKEGLSGVVDPSPRQEYILKRASVKESRQQIQQGISPLREVQGLLRPATAASRLALVNSKKTMSASSLYKSARVLCCESGQSRSLASQSLRFTAWLRAVPHQLAAVTSVKRKDCSMHRTDSTSSPAVTIPHM